MRIGGAIFIAACACTASLLSVHFFLDPAPELRTLVSDDGLFSLDGHVYEEQQITLSTFSAEASAPLFSSRYVLSPKDTKFIEPLQGTLVKGEDVQQLYRWDERGYWVPLPQEEDAHIFSFALPFGGVYAPGKRLLVQVPTFVDVVSALRARLPSETLWYRVHLLARPLYGVPVLVQSSLEEGGCGGLPVAMASSTVFSQEERTVQVLVNDVLTETTFTFLLEIGVAPEGCPQDMPIEVIL